MLADITKTSPPHRHAEECVNGHNSSGQVRRTIIGLTVQVQKGNSLKPNLKCLTDLVLLRTNNIYKSEGIEGAKQSLYQHLW